MKLRYERGNTGGYIKNLKNLLNSAKKMKNVRFIEIEKKMKLQMLFVAPNAFKKGCGKHCQRGIYAVFRFALK